MESFTAFLKLEGQICHFFALYLLVICHYQNHFQKADPNMNYFIYPLLQLATLLLIKPAWLLLNLYYSCFFFSCSLFFCVFGLFKGMPSPFCVSIFPNTLHTQIRLNLLPYPTCISRISRLIACVHTT